MKNPEIDLHGVRHHNVEIIIENFVYQHQYSMPLLIMCGNSNQMIKIVKDKLKEIGCTFDDSRFGLIRVYSI